ncbi:MAG TPA: amidase [Bacteroidales bacterium]|nr:amidase [Bacteroidales bacterium]
MNRKIFFFILLITSFFLGFVAARTDNPITGYMIMQAEKLLGLKFNDSQHEKMLRGLEINLQAYGEIRSFGLPNEVLPALVFNPFPEGFLPPAKGNPHAWKIPDNVSLPADLNELAWFSIPELASLIKHRKISVEELTEFFLSRLEKKADTLKAVVVITRERALASARQADREIVQGRYRGILHGIPYGAKDLLAVEGYYTTWGAAPFKNQKINNTATVVHRLDKAGAILLAKLSLGELAMGDIWFGGQTKNPWNLSQGSSGSSAGSGSVVAAGLLPFAIGSETLGSIVSPATRNGVTGLRPTFGRVSRNGAMTLSWSLDKIGPMSRSAEDCAIVLQAIMGYDPEDPTTVDAGFFIPDDYNLKNLRVGYIKSFFEADYQSKPNDQQVLEDLRNMGFELSEVQWDMPFPVQAMRIILSAEASAAFDELTVSGRDSMLVSQGQNSWPNIFRTSRFIPAAEYINANRIRTKLIERVNQLFSQYDVIVTPSFGGNQLLVTNLTGHPCLVMPNGFDSNGNPVSISFIGNLFDEGKLVALAAAWQKYTGHHLNRPPLFAQD